MRYRNLGSSGIEASVVGLGTWAIGGWMWGGTDEADARDGIRTAVENGVTLIDTAPAYGQGLSEQIIGETLSQAGIARDKVVLATKCGIRWDSDAGYFHKDLDGVKLNRTLKPASIRDELEASLKRLRTEYIDLYQTHWPDEKTPLEDTIDCLLDLKRQGKIRAIGACNLGDEHIEAYRQRAGLAADQEKYSMLDRTFDDQRLPYCRQHTIAFLAYSPLALGLLTGKIGPDRTFGEGDLRNDNPRFSVENRRRVAEMLDAFKPIAETHDLTFAQLTIAWTASQEGVTHVLCGARNARQARENARAGDVELTADEVSRMNDLIEQYAADIP